LRQLWLSGFVIARLDRAIQYSETFAINL